MGWPTLPSPLADHEKNGAYLRRVSPRNIRVGGRGAAATLYGLSTSRPRRRRDPSLRGERTESSRSPSPAERCPTGSRATSAISYIASGTRETWPRRRSRGVFLKPRAFQGTRRPPRSRPPRNRPSRRRLGVKTRAGMAAARTTCTRAGGVARRTPLVISRSRRGARGTWGVSDRAATIRVPDRDVAPRLCQYIFLPGPSTGANTTQTRTHRPRRYPRGRAIARCAAGAALRREAAALRRRAAERHAAQRCAAQRLQAVPCWIASPFRPRAAPARRAYRRTSQGSPRETAPATSSTRRDRAAWPQVGPPSHELSHESIIPHRSIVRSRTLALDNKAAR